MPHTPNGFFYLDDGVDHQKERETAVSLQPFFAEQFECLRAARSAVNTAMDALLGKLNCLSAQLPRNTVGFVKDKDRRTAFDVGIKAVEAVEACTETLNRESFRLTERTQAYGAQAALVREYGEYRNLQRLCRLQNELITVLHAIRSNCLKFFCTRLNKEADLPHKGEKASPEAVAQSLHAVTVTLTEQRQRLSEIQLSDI